MDIAPTLTMYRQTNQEFATKYMGWWFFLIQAAPLPEHLIGLDPQYYLEYNLSVLNKTPGALPPESIEGVSSLLLLHVNDSCHVRGFQSVCGHRS
jgi:haloacetate dehalogenase